MLRSHHCGELRMAHVGRQVTLSGWVQRRRDFGSMSFIDLRDRYGITQLAFNEDTNATLLEEARSLGREFVVTIRGTVAERSNKNPNIPTGDVELIVDHIQLLKA